MKKGELFYILIISALISVMSMGMLKEALSTNMIKSIFALLYVFLLFIFSGILIYNLKKIKLNIENSYFIYNKNYIKTSIISLFILTLYFVLKQIIITIKYSGETNVTTSPLLYLIIIVFSIYMFFLAKLFIALKKESNTITKGINKTIREPLNIDNINLNQYSFLGELSKKRDHNQFIEKKEFNIDKKLYDNYKPVLYSKKFNETGDFILNYTNREDLIFNILIKKNSSVYIKFNKKNKLKESISTEIFERLNAE